jgi:hypothetical protein
MDLSTRPRRRSGRADRLSAIVGAIAFVWASSAAGRARDEAARAQAALAAVETESARAEARLRALGAGAGAEAERLANRVALNAEAPLPRVLAELTDLMPEEVRLRALQVSYDDEVSVEAQVEARSVDAWDAFLDRLATSRRFRGIVPGPEARGGDLRVTIRMRYSPEAS